MKTVICGPAHSGKSVFVANLIRYLPYDSYIRINANGDGEGTWSNNKDQTEVQKARVKTGNDPEDFAIWTERVKNVSADIVLIDIGGRCSDDKRSIFAAADSFIILSSSKEFIKPWKDLGESMNCRCIAILESSLCGEESVDSDDGMLRGRICGLERGTFLDNSSVIKAVVARLVELSGYKHTEIIDFYKVGEILQYANRWLTPDGIPITTIYFPFSAAKPIKEALLPYRNKHHRYRILNLKTNWVAAISAFVLCGDSISDISFYDEWTNSFIAPRQLRISDEVSEDLQFDVRETEDAVYLTAKMSKGQLVTERFAEYRLPRIDENKKLFLSGRFPVWFTVSVLSSYRAKEEYLFQPGNHYVCVKSEHDLHLGDNVNA